MKSTNSKVEEVFLKFKLRNLLLPINSAYIYNSQIHLVVQPLPTYSS